jgi:hypothetical protein
MNIDKAIIFRGREKTDGKWVEGNYVHYTRNGDYHIIRTAEDGIEYHIYRDSLQIKRMWEEEDNGWWENV